MKSEVCEVVKGNNGAIKIGRQSSETEQQNLM